MTTRSARPVPLAGIDLAGISKADLARKFRECLDAGMHGLCFSPYLEGQEPGAAISGEQIRNRIEIVKPYTGWVRTFSTLEGNELIPAIAKENGMKTLVGAWLGKDRDKNNREVASLIDLARTGSADVVAVGNEVLYRKDLPEEELLDHIHRVKRELPDMPVGYVDAYYEFCDRPRITEACDVILANCYPFWEGCPLDYSLLYMKDMYNRALHAAKGKKVIISETGWPNAGSSFSGAEPSAESAMTYFINSQEWSREAGVEMFYFSSFDESWKESDEGDVGAHWGLWDTGGRLKYSET